MNKYIKLYKLFQKEEAVNKVFGLTKTNEKIICYVFNSTYKSFLLKMLEHKINFEKFKKIDDKYKNEYYNKIIYDYNPGQCHSKNKLIDLLITSGIPYICLYIPNAVINAETLLSKNNKKKQELYSYWNSNYFFSSI